MRVSVRSSGWFGVLVPFAGFGDDVLLTSFVCFDLLCL